MIIPDELEFYKNCATLIERVERLQSVLRYPGDVAVMSEVLAVLRYLPELQQPTTENYNV